MVGVVTVAGAGVAVAAVVVVTAAGAWATCGARSAAGCAALGFEMGYTGVACTSDWTGAGVVVTTFVAAGWGTAAKVGAAVIAGFACACTGMIYCCVVCTIAVWVGVATGSGAAIEANTGCGCSGISD